MLSVLEIRNIVFIAVVTLIVCVIIVKIYDMYRTASSSEGFKPHVGYPNDDNNIYEGEYSIVNNYENCAPNVKSFISSVEQLKGTAALSATGYYSGAFGYPPVYSNIVYPYYYDWPYDVFGNFITPDSTCENVGRDTKCYPSHPIKVSVKDVLYPNNTMGVDMWKCCKDRVLN